MVGKKPNILLIMADQLAPQFLSAYGHPLVKTPNLDRLCAEGVVFDAAYTNAPLCAPARYVMMTGRLPSKIGAWDNAAELSSEVPTFAHYLSSLGYRTCLSGKMHFCGPDQLHGFEERLTTDVYPADFTWTPQWDEPEKALDWFHTMEVVRKAGPCLRSTYLDFDDEVTFTAKRTLFDLARGGEERPFCLVASYIHPHDPYINRPEYWDLYADDDIDLPAVSQRDVEDDPHSRRLRTAMAMDDPPPSEAEVRAASDLVGYGRYLDLLGPLPGGVVLLDQPDDGLDFIQVFAKERRVLERQVSALKQHLAPTGMLWICWPKKTSSLKTDLTREVVRAIGLHAGLVDVKVCAIDADWSGLKFVFRLKDR